MSDGSERPVAGGGERAAFLQIRLSPGVMMQLNENQKMIRQMARDFANSRIAPIAQPLNAPYFSTACRV